MGVVTLSCYYVVHAVTGPFEPAYVLQPLPVGSRLGGTCALTAAMVPNSASIALITRFRIIIVLLWISLSDLSMAYGQGLYRQHAVKEEAEAVTASASGDGWPYYLPLLQCFLWRFGVGFTDGLIRRREPMSVACTRHSQPMHKSPSPHRRCEALHLH